MRLNRVLFLLLFTTVVLNSCGVVETIFKAGMWWAFFVVALIIVVVGLIVAKVRK